MNKKFENLNKYTFWKLIAIGCAVFISFCFLICIPFINEAERTIYCLTLIPVGIFMIYSIIHQMVFPLDIRIYAIWIFFFSIICLAYGLVSLGILICSCGILLCRQTYIFNTHKVFKLTLLTVLYILAVLCLLRFDLKETCSKFIELFFAVSAVILTQLIMNKLMEKIKTDILQKNHGENIADYFSQYNFNERDKVMLNEVLSGCKYEEIALNHQLSLSSVKKRLAFLYKKLGVTCQIDFLIKFTGKSSVNSTKV